MKVADELESGFEVGLDYVELEFEHAESFFDVVQLAAEALLFAFEEVERERTGVVGFEHLGSLVESATLPCDELLPFGSGGLAEFGDPLEDHLLSLET